MIRLIQRLQIGAVIAAIFVAISLSASFAQGQQLGPETNRPLPRFASLGAGEVNVRVGPGAQYPVDWTYVRRNLPIEIIREYGNWRQIRDADGHEGWVLSSLLSGERFVQVVAGSADEPLEVRSNPNAEARVVALLQSGVISPVDRCQEGWCRLVDGRFTGWVVQDRLWGVYPDETFN